jgi:anti-sigma factor ChrR (cupin superfamily)
MDAVTPKHQISADRHSHLVRPAEMQWQSTRFSGCEVKVLMKQDSGLMTSLFKFAPGATLDDHEHVAIEQTYLLDGHLVDREGPAAGLEVKKGEFVWREPGSQHSAWSPKGGLTVAIMQVPNKFFDDKGRATDAFGGSWDKNSRPAEGGYSDELSRAAALHDKIPLDRHSHHVKPAEMEWKKTRFPGCEVKVLMAEPKSGLMTSLFKFAPGAELPDHEHVNIEQTYVLEGHLVDKEGPAKGVECKAGEFVWREPGSRHSAWAPNGGLMLAIFQVPNKFFEADGRVTDPSGKLWDETWGHTGKG